MKSLLLIGANGLLGTSLQKTLSKQFDVKTLTRKSNTSMYQVDMSSSHDCTGLLKRVQPDIIVNLAALTDVELCERNIELAYRVNTKITENIGEYTRDNKDVFLIHISTDQVYDANNSYENDIVIRNVYALTKYCGEKGLPAANSMILRTNFFGKSRSIKSEGLCDFMHKLARQGDEITLYNNVYFSPVSIDTLCNIICLCATRQIPGVFNIGSNSGMSKGDFLMYFLKASGLKNFKYKYVPVESGKNKTQRPKDMRMNVKRFETTFDYKLPELISEIESVSDEFKQ
jgi:dTDP-4-dehydrorhamnose reductase